LKDIISSFASGADPNTEGMLHTAAAAGQEALVSILLDFGAQVGKQSLHMCSDALASISVQGFGQSDNANSKDE